MSPHSNHVLRSTIFAAIVVVFCLGFVTPLLRHHGKRHAEPSTDTNLSYRAVRHLRGPNGREFVVTETRDGQTAHLDVKDVALSRDSASETNLNPAQGVGINGRLYALRSSLPGHANLELRELTHQPTYAQGWALTNLQLTIDAGHVDVEHQSNGFRITFKP